MVNMVSLNGPLMSVPSPTPYLHKPADCTPLFFKLGLDWSSLSLSSVCNAKAQWRQGRTANSPMQAKALNVNDELMPSRQCIVLDIEGTTTPISFVFDVLFPYARDNVRSHLTATYDSEETQDDIRLLCAQIRDDLEQGIAGAVPIPLEDAGKEEVIGPLAVNVEEMIRADRKITALKQLQGHIWRTGFQNNELKGVVFEDVPKALEKWHAMGIKVYIYSSGSREAQRLIFGNTIYGDLRRYLCGFFDTMIGNKRETRSYLEIFQSVGADKPSQILFVTDVYQEAMAAKAAGKIPYSICFIFFSLIRQTEAQVSQPLEHLCAYMAIFFFRSSPRKFESLNQRLHLRMLNSQGT